MKRSPCPAARTLGGGARWPAQLPGAREAKLVCFIEYYRAKFGKMPLTKSLKFIAYIISWNVWQMDGLKYCTPGEEPREPSLFDETSNLCRIKDWGATDPKTKRKGTTLTFQELFKKR